MLSTKAGFIAEGGETDGSIRTIAIGETIKQDFQDSDFEFIFEADGSSSGGEEKARSRMKTSPAPLAACNAV